MNGWRARHKFSLQVAALIVGLAMPFALYHGMVSEQVTASIAAFGAIVVGMAVTVWAG